MASACHVCGADALETIPEFAGLGRVTSDTRPFAGRAALAVCGACGALEKVADATWRSECDSIYGAYELYPQGGGAEQRSFDAGSGANLARSERIVRCLAERAGLPARGRLLDVGCGNGGFLRAFGAGFPGWALAGNEIADRDRATILAIPGVEAFHAGGIESVPGRFDLVTMVHVLEHVPGPIEFLRTIRERLAPGGRLAIEVPDPATNPFDLLIEDHATHFSGEILDWILGRAGFEVALRSNEVVPKEWTVVARPGPVRAGEPPGVIAAAVRDRTRSSIAWIRSAADLARRRAAAGPVGIFGTSIAATWLHGEVAGRVAFFVDEDPHRIGRTHLGVPILAPGEVPAGSAVLIVLAPSQAAQVADRLRRAGVSFEIVVP